MFRRNILLVKKCLIRNMFQLFRRNILLVATYNTIQNRSVGTTGAKSKTQ